MQKVVISDVTLREREKNGALSFREKIELVKKLDKLCVDVIETPQIKNTKTDILFLHTISPLLKNSTISCPVGYSEESVEQAASALCDAQKKRLQLMVPTSSVQMEYICRKKPAAVLQMIETLVKKCVSLCEDVEFSALDATRSEPEFLYSAINTAIAAGAKTITVCDSAGEMLPEEFADFIKGLYDNVNGLSKVTLSAECSNALNMASASMVLAVSSGVRQVKVSIDGEGIPSLSNTARIFRTRGETIGIETGLKYTELDHVTSRMGMTVFPEDGDMSAKGGEEFTLGEADDIKTVSAVIKKMGYDLSSEDMAAVYNEITKLTKKKKITAAELDAIIASTAMQAAPTYKLQSYVINSGNIINASAVVNLEKDGEILQGVTVGDGPVDAAFRCIEQIAGRHLELDDFKIRSVTEGREAIGVTVIKLRWDGKLYSGRGTSTDIVESSINAYINALNKICFEEE